MCVRRPSRLHTEIAKLQIQAAIIGLKYYNKADLGVDLFSVSFT